MSDHYAVFGNPISHSKSPLIHTAFAKQTGQDVSYEALLAPLDGFAQAVDTFRATGAKGANVTVPFKLEAFRYATELTERAKLAEAVNTFKFEGDKVLGDNTDGAGLVQDVTVNLGVPLAGKRVLLMGAGGAARGVILPILREHPALLYIANRTSSKSEQLAAQFANYGPVRGGGYDALQESFEVVINATSSGLSDELPPLPDGVFAVDALAYDMMYGKETPFMAFARARGARVADGLGMLVEQAAEAFLVWRGVRPDSRPVMAMLRHA